MGSLPAVELAVLALYLVAMVALGLRAGRGSKGVADFAVGGRALPGWALTLSVVATETSTVTFLSVPSLAYRGDLSFLQLPMGYVVGRLAVALWLVPAYFRGEATTAYELLGQRFGGRVKPVASTIFLVARNSSDGLRLFLGGVVLEATLGLDLWLSVAVLGVLTIAYTFVGGIRAVVWMDVVQFVVYGLGALLAAFTILHALPGGVSQVLEVVGREGRWDLFSGRTRVFDLQPAWDSASFLGAGLIGGAFLSFATHGADQMMVQRLLCARSARTAQRCVVASGFVVLLQFALFLGLGSLLWVWFGDLRASLEAAGESVAAATPGKDRELATYVVEHLRWPTGAAGVVLGAVFAASMSTLSSSLNSSAVSVVRDFGLAAGDDHRQLRIIRAMTVLFGLVQIAVGIGAQSLDAGVVGAVLRIAGFSSGLLLGLFLLGLCSARADARAAMVGLCVGAAGTLFVAFGTSLAWPWYAMVASMSTLLVGLVVARGSSKEIEA